MESEFTVDAVETASVIPLLSITLLVLQTVIIVSVLGVVAALALARTLLRFFAAFARPDIASEACARAVRTGRCTGTVAVTALVAADEILSTKDLRVEAVSIGVVSLIISCDCSDIVHFRVFTSLTRTVTICCNSRTTLSMDFIDIISL